MFCGWFIGHYWGTEEEMEQENYVKRCFRTTLSSSLIPDLKVHSSQFFRLQIFNEWQKLSIWILLIRPTMWVQHLHSCAFCWEGFSVFDLMMQVVSEDASFLQVPSLLHPNHLHSSPWQVKQLPNMYSFIFGYWLLFFSSHNNDHTISANLITISIIRNFIDCVDCLNVKWC